MSNLLCSLLPCLSGCNEMNSSLSGQAQVCLNNSIIFTATVENNVGSTSYKWQLDGVIMSETSNQFSTPSSLSSGQHSLTVTVTDSCNRSVSDTATFIVIGEPDVVISPDNSILCSSSTVTLTSTVTNGLEPYQYQWSVSSDNTNYVDIINATNPELLVTNNNLDTHAPDDLKYIKVIVIDSCGNSVDSNVVQVTTYKPLSNPNIIYTEDEFCPYDSTNKLFTITHENGSNNISIQWKLNDVIQNTTAKDIYINSQLLGVGINTLSVQVTDNICNDIVNASVDLMLYDIPVANFTPNLARICPNSEQIFSVVHPQPYVTYQWFINDILSTSGEMLVINNMASGTYAIKLLAFNNCDSSEAFGTLEVYSDFSVNIEPNYAEICSGNSIRFTSNIDNPSGNFTNKWYLDGVLQSTTNPYFDTPTSLGSGDHIIRLVVSSCSYSHETFATLTVYSDFSLAINPNYLTICQDSTTQINTLIDREGNFTYQWFLDDIIQSSTESYFITPPNLPLGDHMVKVVVSSCNFSHQAISTLSVIRTPQLEISPANIDICSNDSITFTVTNSNPYPVNYRWFINNTEQIGHTNSSLTLYNLEVGSYNITVEGSNNCGANFASATLNVSSCNELFITPQITEICKKEGGILYKTYYILNGENIVYNGDLLWSLTRESTGEVLQTEQASFISIDITPLEYNVDYGVRMKGLPGTDIIPKTIIFQVRVCESGDNNGLPK